MSDAIVVEVNFGVASRGDRALEHDPITSVATREGSCLMCQR